MPFDIIPQAHDENIMHITSADLSCSEKTAEILLDEMRDEYADDALMACMNFDRSVLGKEGRVITRGTIDKFLGLIK